MEEANGLLDKPFGQTKIHSVKRDREETNVSRVIVEMASRFVHFLKFGQLIGISGSFGPSQSTVPAFS